MKRIALFFVMIVTAISCVSEETVTPEISVLTTGDELVLSPAEGIIPVAFKVNTDWTAEIKEPEAREWCAVSPSRDGKPGDNVLNVICIENKTPDNRTATVLIKAMDLVEEVSITQLQKDVLVLTAKEEYAVPYQGQDISFKVSRNLDLRIQTDADWITEVKTKALVEEEYTFKVAFNDGKERVGKISFTAGDLHEEIIVKQDAWVLEFNVTPAEDKAFAPEGGQHKVTIESNVDYTVNVPTNDWLTVEKSEGEYTFTASANNTLTARELDVRISPKSAKYVSSSKIIKMSQKAAGAKLDLSELEKKITYQAQTFDLTVDATIEYEMSYKKYVEGEYVDLDAGEKWLSHSTSGNVYTFSAEENVGWSERSLVLCFVPKDAAYQDMTVIFPVYQYGHAMTLWTKQITAIDGYDAALKLRLALYGDKLLLANTTKVYVMNPSTGEVESTIAMPEGILAHSVLVDDAGNFMIAADAPGMDAEKAPFAVEMKLYYVADPMNPVLEEVAVYNTGSYYCADTGNFRVKGDIKNNAVVAATVSDGAGGAAVIWEVKDGVWSDYALTNVPYAGGTVASACTYPVGDKLSDGLLYIAYGGTYDLMYAVPVFDDEGNCVSDWTTSFVTGSTWQENYNCISTTKWNGHSYAAILMGCHFSYDDADMVLLNIDDPASSEHLYTYAGTGDVQRAEDWTNLYWTDKGTFSDIILIPTDDVLLMIGADSNYGTITCVAIM